MFFPLKKSLSTIEELRLIDQQALISLARAEFEYRTREMNIYDRTFEKTLYHKKFTDSIGVVRND